MRTAGILFILVCAASLFASSQVESGGNASAEIRALELEWSEGQARNDNRALDLIFDNGLVYVEYGKLITKGEYLLRVRRSTPSLQPSIFFEAMTVRTVGDTAIVVGTYREASLKGGRTMVQRWRFVDTWVYKNGHWMLVAAAAAPMAR